MPLMPTTVFQHATSAQVLLDEIFLSGTGAIEFLDIPGTYTHLHIVCQLRGVGGATEEALRLRFNNDASTVGQGNYVSSLNATFSSASDASGAFILCGITMGGSADASRFSAVTFEIPNYASGNFKSATAAFAGAFTTTQASIRSGVGGGIWPVATAISRVLIWTGTGGGQFAAGSKASLYGIA